MEGKECSSGSWKGKEMDPPLELPEGSSPAQTVTLATETDFGLLASRTVKELICAVLSHSICGY